jgi:soluble lytic murein transglycosylase
MKTLIFVLAVGMVLTATAVQEGSLAKTVATLPQVETVGQTNHSIELLRRSRGPASVLTESRTEMRSLVLAAVEASIPQEFRVHAFEIARAVIQEANHHHMDPFFLLAVVKTESKFNMNAVGTHGEIGLMQILPSTAAWLAPQAGISGKPDLRNPAVNIRIGAVYFAQLRKAFEGRPQRYVGAYNMGAANVRRLVASNTEPYIYAGKVLSNYKHFYREIALSGKGSQTLADGR